MYFESHCCWRFKFERETGELISRTTPCTFSAAPDSSYIDPVVRTDWNVNNNRKTYYFSVIDIFGNTATVNSYKGFTGQYKVFETFTITK